MRKTVKIGAGLTSAAIVASLAAGVASAAASGQHRATASASTDSASTASASTDSASTDSASTDSASVVSVATAHVTRAQARHLARAAVPHSRVIEAESDDLHDRAVWKVQLATPHGRVVVDVDKRTGQVTIIRGHRHGGHGHGDGGGGRGHDGGQDHNRGHDGDG